MRSEAAWLVGSHQGRLSQDALQVHECSSRGGNEENRGFGNGGTACSGVQESIVVVVAFAFVFGGREPG